MLGPGQERHLLQQGQCNGGAKIKGRKCEIFQLLFINALGSVNDSRGQSSLTHRSLNTDSFDWQKTVQCRWNTMISVIYVLMYYMYAATGTLFLLVLCKAGCLAANVTF